MCLKCVTRSGKVKSFKAIAMLLIILEISLSSMQNVDQAIKNAQASPPFDNAVDIYRSEIKTKTLAEKHKKSL